MLTRLPTKLFQNLSANTGQLLINQFAGFIIFYLLSTQLPKERFGDLNFVLATMLIVFNLLPLGIDQVVVRKIAMGRKADQLLPVYLSHILLTAFLFCVTLISFYLFNPQVTGLYPLFFTIGVGKLLLFCSTPFKQVVNGLEKFRLLACMGVVSNIVRTLGLMVLALSYHITLAGAMLVFVLGDLIEFILTIYLFKHRVKIPIIWRWNTQKYIQLVKEAMPQAGVVVLTSVMARLDWVLIGLLVSSAKLAEYSFAFKLFEISTLPLLAIAPLLLPWFTKALKNASAITTELNLLMRTELIIAVLTALILNFLWLPVVDTLTDGKYSTIHVGTIFFLSLCIPFLYVNNFLWTIYFAQGQKKIILTSFVITFFVTLGLDLILIPLLQDQGAAIAFLCGCVAQTISYLWRERIPGLYAIWKRLLICLSCAFIAGFTAKICFSNVYVILLLALGSCILLLAFTKQIIWKPRAFVHSNQHR